jgi:hypothetical protein
MKRWKYIQRKIYGDFKQVKISNFWGPVPLAYRPKVGPQFQKVLWAKPSPKLVSLSWNLTIFGLNMVTTRPHSKGTNMGAGSPWPSGNYVCKWSVFSYPNLLYTCKSFCTHCTHFDLKFQWRVIGSGMWEIFFWNFSYSCPWTIIQR